MYICVYKYVYEYVCYVVRMYRMCAWMYMIVYIRQCTYKYAQVSIYAVCMYVYVIGGVLCPGESAMSAVFCLVTGLVHLRYSLVTTGSMPSRYIELTYTSSLTYTHMHTFSLLYSATLLICTCFLFTSIIILLNKQTVYIYYVELPYKR